MLIHSKYRPSPSFQSLCVGDESVAASQSAGSLGVIFDEDMSFHAHVSIICRSSFYHLRNLSRIRKYFTKESAEVAVHAFVTSKLDYCNALLYGLPKYQLQRLQYVQNTAATIVLQVSKFQHITPVLCELHWLPIQYRIIFKILLLVYKSLNGTSPSYLDQKLYYRSHTRSLRSVSNGLLMQEHLLFIHQESGTSYPMKFGSPTPFRVLKDHLRRTCLLNSVITDHCFYRFVYIPLVLIVPFYHYE